MLNKKILIIGYGSIAIKHYKKLIKINSSKNIYFFSRRNLNIKNQLNNIIDIKKFNPEFIYICVETSKHHLYLNKFNKLFKNKIIFIEKPLFHKDYKINEINNNIYVGYNLRFHPIINYIKKIIVKKKIYSVNIEALSYLPNWRKNTKYFNSYSANKNRGGGVLLDLSHELDYLLLFFKELKINFIKNNKISDLRINSDDFLFLNASNMHIKNINLTLSYFSLFSKRIIEIHGKNFSLEADLIKNKINISSNKQKKIYTFKKEECDTYSILNKNLLQKKFKMFADYKEGIKVMQLIDKIRKFK